ncbi:hypothetical protein LNKW23_46190 [Paralimibaculum aggregatum]|uniref:Uncharacterized protein n=1 Tax=Paralimibaculum aggregatum TaxID=3036245 RepID=A0ABQ6LTI7_9RHOB|nr:hypothetical protein LNKW23_46190 [Limibaculum sp. NKW23]
MRDKRQDGGLRLGQDALRNLDPPAPTLHGGAAHEAQVVEEGAQIPDVERRLGTLCPTSASARLAPASAAAVRMASNSAFGTRTKPCSERGGVMVISPGRGSADLRAPEHGVVRGEMAVGRPQESLRLDGVADRE